MRTIKFRGKRIDNGLWMYGFVLHCDRYTDIWSAEGKFDRREVDPETVGQFTGLIDKNGQEIYEGDILGWKTVICEEDGVEAFYGKVTFTDGVFCIDDDWESSVESVLCESEEFCVARVIGNIHDNPKLLEGGAQ